VPENYKASKDVHVETGLATQERWEDIQSLFKSHGHLGCWCQYWRLSSSKYRRRPPGSGEIYLKSQVVDGPPPGLIAYVEGEPAGWLGFWPRQRLERLVRSRTIPLIDDSPVWSIVCFMVRVGFRRLGVARALLQGAIDFARKEGIPTLEAYPIETYGERVDVAFGYVGFVHMFEEVGFRRVLETDARSARRPRNLMRLDLEKNY
jgi:GNAT superfamily N-acetyltransferase